MDFSASALLATISLPFPPTNDILRNFCGADATHVTSRLLAYKRRTSQNSFGRVTYREDLVEMSGGITGLQHRFFAPSGAFSWYVFLRSLALRITVPAIESDLL